jgi:hypothetical protein
MPHGEAYRFPTYHIIHSKGKDFGEILRKYCLSDRPKHLSLKD